MAEKSLFWYTDGFTGATGDGAAPYTQEEFRAYNAANHGDGVVAGVLNELSVGGIATPMTVATGRAWVNGFPYLNDAAVNLTVTTPSVGTTGGRIILRATWATAEVRLAVLMNTDGVAAIPALTQTSGTTWEISLASFTVTTAGVIARTDTRMFVIPDDAIEMRRQGAAVAPESWSTAGTVDFHIPNALVQFGAVAISAGGVGSVTFPKPYTGAPLVFVQFPGTSDFSIVVTNTTLTVNDDVGSRTAYWLAIGPPE